MLSVSCGHDFMAKIQMYLEVGLVVIRGIVEVHFICIVECLTF